MRWMLCASILAGLSGCQAYTLDVDGRIVERAVQPIDVQPVSAEPLPLKDVPKMLPPVEKDPPPTPKRDARDAPRRGAELIFVSAQKEGPLPGKDKSYAQMMMDRLRLPKEALDVDVPDLKLWGAGATDKEKDEAIKRQFPKLDVIKNLSVAGKGPDGRPLSISDLQQIALRTNPLIRQAHLDIEAARGLALQAKLYPNPTIGYEGDTIGLAHTSGTQGGYVQQVIKTGRKLELAHAAALEDVSISEQRLRQAETDLQAQVRAGYFAVLSAQKNYNTNKALAQLTDELYNVLLLQLRNGQAAGYEPMQIRVLALQARASLIQAQNRYSTAWKQLAAALGTPTMPLTEVAGQIDMPVPLFDHERVLAYVLNYHTDVLSARFGVDKARLLTRLAEVQPIPDVNVSFVVQSDRTTQPFSTSYNLNIGGAFPLWDRNQGNIQAARALMQRALADDRRVKNDLTGRVAEVFERYDNNRTLLKMYKEQILPNQVQAFRAAVARHAAQGNADINYNDLVTSQQTLATLIGNYLGALSDQWTAVVDITHLLQTRDLFQTQPLEEVAPVPEVHEILRDGFLHRR